MIKIPALLQKLNSIKASDKDLFDKCSSFYDLKNLKCDKCGMIGQFTKHSSYSRYLIYIEDGKKNEIMIKVKRVICSCRHTHALIPDNLIPSSPYSIRFILKILWEFLNRTDKVSDFCKVYDITEKTIYNWYYLFIRNYQEWIEQLDCEKELVSSQLSELTNIECFPEKFYQKTGHFFLQRTTHQHNITIEYTTAINYNEFNTERKAVAKMNEQLKEKTQEWMSLERKTLEQRKKADQYYEKNLMKLIEKDFIERNKDVVKDQVDYLLVSVGTSYEPIVLDLVLLKPKNIAFLYTEKSKDTLNKVVDYVNLKASQFEKKKIDETDPIDIYRNVKDIYLYWNSPSEMYIDFTGGTKAMSAACALAGAIIDVRMVYVASDDYLVDFRKPNPGSEKLIYIDNPLSVFGDLEVDKAYELFRKYNFEGAGEKFEFLKENIPNPVQRQELCFSFLLAGAYSRWDALEFPGAAKTMNELNQQLERDRKEFSYHELVKKKDMLEEQLARLNELARIPHLITEKKQQDILRIKEIIVPLMFTMVLNARTRESQQKYDMATLLMYRLLEMIEQRRLSKYNLYVADMIYEEMRPNEKRTPELVVADSNEMKELLSQKVYEIKREIFGPRTGRYLPNPVSLLDGYIILAALCDPIVTSPQKSHVNILKQMRSMVYQRNNSIFAHGLGPVSKQDYIKFRDFVTMIFKQFCKIERIDFEHESDVFQWIMPIDSGDKE